MASPDPRGFASRPKKQASIAEAVARRDNIGTLAALTIDIVTLSPLFHFHGGAPRGERPASWDAPGLTRADQSRLARATTTQVRLSALRPPLVGVDAKGKQRTRAQQRAAGTKNTALFDIVNLRRRPTAHARAAIAHASHSRVPGERASASEDPGPRGVTAKSMYMSPLGPGSRFARPGHELTAQSRATASPSRSPARRGRSNESRRNRRRRRRGSRIR